MADIVEIESYLTEERINKAVKEFQDYQTLKQKLSQEGDFVTYTTRDGKMREIPTKQWRTKLTRFFNIKLEIVKEEYKEFEDGTFIFNITARATAPNGYSIEALGSAWSKTLQERIPNRDIYHITRTLAETRAKNRAVFELVGFGEVSAEEVEEERRTTSELENFIEENKIEEGLLRRAIEKIAPQKNLQDLSEKEAQLVRKYLTKVVENRQIKKEGG